MKVYINFRYCPQAVAEDLFGDIISDKYFKYTPKIVCWNGVAYNLIYANLDTWEFYFEIDEF